CNKWGQTRFKSSLTPFVAADLRRCLLHRRLFRSPECWILIDRRLVDVTHRTVHRESLVLAVDQTLGAELLQRSLIGRAECGHDRLVHRRSGIELGELLE